MIRVVEDLVADSIPDEVDVILHAELSTTLCTLGIFMWLRQGILKSPKDEQGSLQEVDTEQVIENITKIEQKH